MNFDCENFRSLISQYFRSFTVLFSCRFLQAITGRKLISSELVSEKNWIFLLLNVNILKKMHIGELHENVSTSIENSHWNALRVSLLRILLFSAQRHKRLQSTSLYYFRIPRCCFFLAEYCFEIHIKEFSTSFFASDFPLSACTKLGQL